MPKTLLFTRLKERKMVQWALAYLAGAFVVGQALEVVEGRANSFWTSISRHPKQHAAWEAARDLARLAMAIYDVKSSLSSAPGKPKDWAQAYTVADAGWHKVDQLYRQARYRISRMEEDAVLEQGCKKVFGQYEALVQRLGQAGSQCQQSFTGSGATRKRNKVDFRIH